MITGLRPRSRSAFVCLRPATAAVNRGRITPYKAQAKLAEWARQIERAPDGDQNKMINRAAHIVTRDFCPPLDPEEMRARLELAAEKGNHPEHRAEPSVRSGMQSGLGTSAPK